MYKYAIAAFLFIVLPVSAYAQGRVVKGVVTDDEGPLIGASVMLKGTNIGTAAGMDGTYSLNVPSDDAVLVFSSIGYKTVELVVGNRKVIDVLLDVEQILLEDVVVIVYGTQAK